MVQIQVPPVQLVRGENWAWPEHTLSVRHAARAGLLKTKGSVFETPVLVSKLVFRAQSAIKECIRVGDSLRCKLH